MARVKWHQNLIINRARKLAIARTEYRVEKLNTLHEKALQVIDERGADPTMAGVPGGKTGLLTRKYKNLGENGGVVEEYEVDTGVMGEIRNLQKAAAEELGQRGEKPGGPFPRVVIDIPRPPGSVLDPNQYQEPKIEVLPPAAPDTKTQQSVRVVVDVPSLNRSVDGEDLQG